VLAGFFGRGNAGDEAILQGLVEALPPGTEPIICVPQHGAFDGFWNWYPYNQYELIDQGNLGVFERRDVVGLNVGGGGLAPAFNCGQITAAKFEGKTVSITGVDDPLRFIGEHADADVARRFFENIDYYSVRSRKAQERAQSIGLSPDLGADWAALMPIDESEHPHFDGVSIVIREFDVLTMTPEQTEGLNQLLRALKTKGIPVQSVPFSPEDERFLSFISEAWDIPIERHWWNPRRALEVLIKSTIVVSVGRLHPIILAALKGSNLIAVDMADIWRSQSKLLDAVDEFGVRAFGGVRDFVAAIEADTNWQYGANDVSEDYATRLQEMIDRLIECHFG
jgi:hypothetical protein